MMRAEASWCKPFRRISEVDDVAAPQTGWARALMLRYAGALPHANLASVPNSPNVPAGLSDDPQGVSGKAQAADAICSSVVLRGQFFGDHLESRKVA
jgi:hypothetical protein